MDKVRDAYEKLYDIASYNLFESGGGTFEYSREVFLASTCCKPGEADLLLLNDLDNMSYIQGLYVFLFYRSCDIGSLRAWTKDADMPQEEFRQKAVKSLSSSQEFYDKGVALVNNQYSSHNKANREIVVYGGGLPVGTGHPAEVGVNKLYRFYKKLPKSIRDLIRKIIGIK